MPLACGEGECWVVPESPPVDVQVRAEDEPLHHLQLARHGRHHQPRGAAQHRARAGGGARGVHIHSPALTKIKVEGANYISSPAEQLLHPGDVAHGAGLQEVHEVGRGEAQAGQQPGVEAGVAMQLDTCQQGDEMI